LTITGGTGSSLSNPQITIYDFTDGNLGGEIDCIVGSNLGAITASGWSVNDQLLVRLSASGNIGVCFEEFTLPPPSANDLCASSIVLVCGETVTGNTVNDNDEHNPFRAAGNDVYYKFTETVQKTVTVTLCGSGFDTRLYVYRDGCTFANLVVENDDSCGGQSEVTFTAVPMVEYTIVVDGFGTGATGTGASGAFTLGIGCEVITIFNCADTIVDDGGIGGDYSNNQFTTHNIDSGDPTLVPTLNFTEFDIESDWDYMRFYDGADSTADEIITSVNGATTFLGVGFTGTALLGDQIVGTNQFLTVTFESDAINVGSFEGYVANITCAEPFAGSTGRQEYTAVHNRKAVVRTEAQIAERKALIEEHNMRLKLRRSNQK
jgi:hypothetical protein